MARGPVITGNWKMHKTSAEGTAFVQKLLNSVDSFTQVWLAVPFTCLSALSGTAGDSSIKIGAQNMHPEAKGAFTGEISAEMLRDSGAEFVLLGHSERRHLFGESDEFVNQKVHRALQSGLIPVVCIGETLEQRRAGKTEAVIDAQLDGSLKGLNGQEVKGLILAYEPVWAIGTGETATPDQAEEVHAHIRRKLRELWGEEVADQVVIQYGGSVKPQNAGELMAQANIDGVLVGGASLDVETFAQIVNYNKKMV